MHPKYQKLLDPIYFEYAQNIENNNRFATLTLEQRRKNYLQSCPSQNTHKDITAGNHEITARDGYAVPIRVYHNANFPSNNALTVYLHGGGWILGNLDSHQDICSDICAKTKSSVLAIDYRLAPENPFPIPLNDCIDVIQIIQSSIGIADLETDNIVLCGDSAGANLAVASCLSGQIDTEKISGQVLIYPGLGATSDLPSFMENEFAPILPKTVLEEFFLYYLGGDRNAVNELTSPLLASDLSQMPVTYLSAANYDPLRDDAIEFFKKLQSHKIVAKIQIEENLGHGYLRVRNTSHYAGHAFTSLCSAIQQMHNEQFNC